VHRLLVDEQQDGGTDVTATGAPAAVVPPGAAAGALVGRLAGRAATAAGMVVAAADVLAALLDGVQDVLLVVGYDDANDIS